jgi:protein-S-isoprenylcysteine O-methyltransferase Ste14
MDSREQGNNFVLEFDMSMKHGKKFVLSYLWSSLLVAQILLVFVFGMNNMDGLQLIKFAGWIIWALSVIFGWLPIFILKKKGGVGKGKSYVHTSVLVDSGLYAIVRHPQYTAGILFSLALILISQTWLITAMGLVVIMLLYLDILNADKYEIQKFGDAYKRYMKKVPGTNFLLGVIRILRQKSGIH